MSEITTAADAQYPPPIYQRIEERPAPTVPRLSAGRLGWLVVAGFAANLAFRTELLGAASLLAVAIIVGPLMGDRFKQSASSTAFAGAALVFALWLPVRASTWLTALNSVAVAAALTLAAITAQPLTLRLDIRTLKTVLSRLILFPYAFELLSKATKRFRFVPGGRAVSVMRGIAIAALPIAILAALLASADAAFARSFRPGFDLAGLLSHSVLTIVSLVAIASLIALTSEPGDESFVNNKPLGGIEALVLLASMGTLYAAFAVVQLIGIAGGLDRILEEEGLTQAHYARSGFFQLLWVAGLTIVLLAVVRMFVTNATGRIDRAVRWSGGVVSLLTILIVAVAISRLGLYTDAFGQTTFRWYCTAFAWMLGVIFVALAFGHAQRAEHLVPIAVLTIVAVTLLSVNVLNPESRVADHNLNRSSELVELDANYLLRLSADAWPQLLAHEDRILDRLNETRSHSPDTLASACDRAAKHAGFGPFGFNLARSSLSCPTSDG